MPPAMANREVILTNLAKVHSRRGNEAKAEAILWKALERDPNQDNGMGWYAAIHKERGGDGAGLDALYRLAEIPGSWRAQLAGQGRPAATGPGRRVGFVSRGACPHEPCPSRCLDADQRRFGKCRPPSRAYPAGFTLFQCTLHGLQVGNNLIKAHLDLGQIDAARGILDLLYALNRPDWKSHLAYWDTELAKANLATTTPMSPGELKIVMATIEGPIWLKPTSPAAELFPRGPTNPYGSLSSAAARTARQTPNASNFSFPTHAAGWPGPYRSFSRNRRNFSSMCDPARWFPWP